MIFINDFYFFEFLFVWGASPGSAGYFKKVTQTPNAGHPFIPNYAQFIWSNRDVIIALCSKNYIE
jgi:hypothetical protein